ncbi:hypothetical protein HZA26_02650 [Candidatus Nomurabacteria bacterium]|nr:hypothetical protein [Candidatus Nomurabacteria bacterium]
MRINNNKVSSFLALLSMAFLSTPILHADTIDSKKIIKHLKSDNYIKRHVTLQKLERENLSLQVQNELVNYVFEILLFDKISAAREEAEIVLIKSFDTNLVTEKLKNFSLVNTIFPGMVELGNLFLHFSFTEEAKILFISASKAQDSEIRYKAIDSLNNKTIQLTKNEQKLLLEILHDDPSEAVQSVCLKTLGGFSNLDVVHELAFFLNNSLIYLRTEAAFSIIKILNKLALDEKEKTELISYLKITHERKEVDPSRVDQAKRLDDKLNTYPACTLLAVFSQKYEDSIVVPRLTPEEVNLFQEKIRIILQKN